MKRTLTIENERACNWQDMYSGVNHHVRTNTMRRAHVLVRERIDAEDEPFKCPVDITITSYVPAHPMDPDNICSKVYIDALKGWWLLDDNPSCVSSVTTRSKYDKSSPPHIVIEVDDHEGPAVFFQCMECAAPPFFSLADFRKHLKKEHSLSFEEV